MPVDQRFDQFTAVQLVIVICVVHFEIMKLELLICHFACVNWHFHVLSYVTKIIRSFNKVRTKYCVLFYHKLTLFPFVSSRCVRLVVVHDAHVRGLQADDQLLEVVVVADGPLAVAAVDVAVGLVAKKNQIYNIKTIKKIY